MSKQKTVKTRAGQQLGPKDWVNAARKALVKAGVAIIKVELLAKDLSATTGSFYWHYKKRSELLDDLLDEWAQDSVAVFARAVEAAGDDKEKRLLAFVRIWFDSRTYLPALDAAVRDWARTSKQVKKKVQETDEKRIKILQTELEAFDITTDDAFIRARIIYFHQIGYYTIEIQETLKQRLVLLPRYMKALVGQGRISTAAIADMFGPLYKKANLPLP